MRDRGEILDSSGELFCVPFEYTPAKPGSVPVLHAKGKGDALSWKGERSRTVWGQLAP